MKYYKDASGQLYAYEADGSQDHIIPDGLTRITNEEFEAATAPTQKDLEDIARAERDRLLALHVDPVVSNPLRWADTPPEKQQQIINYRAALLDVPQQPGFPDNIQWPIAPV